MNSSNGAEELLNVARWLSTELSRLRFGRPVTHVYDPSSYAFAPYRCYVTRWGGQRGRVVLLGMNPGPFGMTQTGIPFGDPEMVQRFLNLSGHVLSPSEEHPKRPVRGFHSARREVSGSRLWGWAQRRFGSADEFFRHFFVLNYCPLCFVEESGRNRTPDKLPAAERSSLYELCDEALRRSIRCLESPVVVGIGAFAAARASEGLSTSARVGRILHPSPANPRANRGWEHEVEEDLRAIGLSYLIGC